MLEIELLLIFVCSVIGMTNILVDSELSKNTFKYVVRFLFLRIDDKFSWIKEGIDCHMCMGFWSGIFCSYLLGLTPHICFGFAGSFLASFYIILIDYLVSNTAIPLEDIK